MIVLWVCSSGHRGEYDTVTIKTKTDAALPCSKHAATCPAAVMTTTSPGLAVRFGGGGGE